jgi:hypothetical protein
MPGELGYEINLGPHVFEDDRVDRLEILARQVDEAFDAATRRRSLLAI